MIVVHDDRLRHIVPPRVAPARYACAPVRVAIDASQITWDDVLITAVHVNVVEDAPGKHLQPGVLEHDRVARLHLVERHGREVLVDVQLGETPRGHVAIAK